MNLTWTDISLLIGGGIVCLIVYALAYPGYRGHQRGMGGSRTRYPRRSLPTTHVCGHCKRSFASSSELSRHMDGACGAAHRSQRGGPLPLLILRLQLTSCTAIQAQDAQGGTSMITITPAMWGYGVGGLITGIALVTVLCKWRYEAGWLKCYAEVGEQVLREQQSESRARLTLACLRGELTPDQIRAARRIAERLAESTP